MAINSIDYSLCTGCGKCVNACWHDVLRMDKESKKPIIAYQDDCIICSQCWKDCPVKAVRLAPGVTLPITSFVPFLGC